MDTGTLSWKPYRIVGGSSPFGLAVPPAKATPYTLYGPRGVFYNGSTLVVADTGNHRVLIWFGLPEEGRGADVVLGQPNFYSDSPNAGGDPERGMFMPTGVWITEEGHLLVADAWNHRILLWERIPERSFVKPDSVLGQRSLRDTDRNVFFWCFGVAYHDGKLYVCDTGNRRVLMYEGLPSGERKPDEVYEGFAWPHSLAFGTNFCAIADAGSGISNVFIFSEKPGSVREVVTSLGDGEGCGARLLNLPYGVSAYGKILAVADTSNNRVLVYVDPLSRAEPVGVLGQRDLCSCGENRWEAVLPDTLCWPYSLHLRENLLLIADTGNNRVVIWRQQEDN
ncbi:NHL repeat containing protein [Thermocrinis albus DSM 14484]|uniref:NHL repeat containing protein n=1 Tax=Thermocrinis albus (strain DSM 14484 / JCM 11386 / HI 11/12) TaxID=638303 RepID=D3SMQ2_THEAH|nr:NHL repeat-containing protein [Thermocrinis albus]ADC90032.1 NHL repeat containing protein [Thermocrinis albus DSM 14484]